MIAPGQTLSLAIEKPAAGGRMIARDAGGQIVLVAGAIPGERVRARVERLARHVAYAETTAVDEPSPDRRDPGADLLCGGCLYGHIHYARQLELKRQVVADAFARIGRLVLPSTLGVAPSREDGYRMRARLHVRGQRLGFFREGTHEVCDPRQTRQLLPDSCDALDRLMAVARSLGIVSIREIDLAENGDASDRVAALETEAPIAPHAMDRMAATEGLTGIVSASAIRGRAHVTDRLVLASGADVTLRRHVLAFFQGNRHLLGALASHVVGEVPEGGALVDLYAGVGLFAVSAAAARGARVTAVEGDRIAAADLSANAAPTDGLVTPRHGAVEAFLQGATAAVDAAIVDPPRTGMTREALDGLLRLGAPRVIYVSCDVATLARDARRLVDAGYTVRRADAFDLFPNTPHVETVVVFVR